MGKGSAFDSRVDLVLGLSPGAAAVATVGVCSGRLPKSAQVSDGSVAAGLPVAALLCTRAEPRL